MRILTLIIVLVSTANLKGQSTFRGIWQLKHYVDSTQITKSISKYSHSPASYCYEIIIDSNQPKQVEFIGYHEGGPIPVLESNIRELKIGYSEDQFYLLTLVNDSTISFKEGKLESVKNVSVDPQTHFFSLTEQSLANLNTFFNSFIDGSYLNQENNEVNFDINGRVSGIGDFNSYELTIDFGGHPPGSFDSILFRSPNGDYEYRAWSIINNNLILCELDRTIDEHEGNYIYSPSQNCMMLIRK